MKKAFTLVELMISMAIFSLLIVVLGNVFASIVEARLRSQAESSVAREATWIFSRMGYDIARASAITSPSIGSSSNSMILTIGGSPYVYKLLAGKLYFGPQGSEQAIVDSDIVVSNFLVERQADIVNKNVVRVTTELGSSTVLPGTGVRLRQIITTFATR